MVIHHRINIHRTPDPKLSNLIFNNGSDHEIPFGTITKKMVCAMQGDLIHVVFHEKGPEATWWVFTGIQVVVNY